jgi:hypothetical protein
MDQLQTRLEALEQQMLTVTRRLRWWRGLAGSLLVLAVLTWVLPVGTAPEGASTGGQKGLAQRVAALEDLLQHFSRKGNDVFITRANLHLVNGLGETDCVNDQSGEEIPDCPNGVGNLIVGYNEPRSEGTENIRTGSHNVVVGQRHNFSRFGGLVVGDLNTISGDFSSVSGGIVNTASGQAASISGGAVNTASGPWAAVSGGTSNTASGSWTAVSGGAGNTASGDAAAVCGGASNMASGIVASISGGQNNTASGRAATVSGGGIHPISGEGLGNTASGAAAAVCGGQGNEASGDLSSISGGRNRTAEDEFNWVAGSLVEDE